MSKFIDMTGRVFGRLKVIARAKNGILGQSRWHCICSCGKEKTIPGGRLRFGSSLSCGCASAEKTSKRRTIHGYSKKIEGNKRQSVYSTWCGMKTRCENSNFPSWKSYGGRGIKVCDRWQTFSNFLEDMGTPPKGKTLDRIDNSKGYSKDNCRWADSIEQANNTRRNIMITYEGSTMTLSNWCRKLGIDAILTRRRLYDGWSISRAFTEPGGQRGSNGSVKIPKK